MNLQIKDLSPFNINGLPHGFWFTYYYDINYPQNLSDRISYIGHFNNGKQVGYWRFYSDNIDNKLRTVHYIIT